MSSTTIVPVLHPLHCFQTLDSMHVAAHPPLLAGSRNRSAGGGGASRPLQLALCHSYPPLGFANVHLAHTTNPSQYVLLLVVRHAQLRAPASTGGTELLVRIESHGERMGVLPSQSDGQRHGTGMIPNNDGMFLDRNIIERDGLFRFALGLSCVCASL